MKKYIEKNIKGLILVIIGFISLTFLFVKDNRTSYQDELVMAYDIITEEKKENNLDNYQDTINFYANVFQIDNLKLNSLLEESYDLIDFNNFDKYLIDYLFDLEKTNKDLFSNKLTSGIGTKKEYILDLINYYAYLYQNVDYSIATSIAHIESGFRAQSMLKYNNIFGGMSKGKLIHYKNIEYGILKYIKLLSESYFGIGLNTIESIGKKYNPVYEGKNKKANPTWVKNVNSVLNKYQDYDVITSIFGLDV